MNNPKPHFHLETMNESKTEGVYALYPLPRGFGHTTGNVLRRVLLSSLEGAAVTYLKIEGVSHPFTTVKGLKENVLTFILNLKKLRFQFNSDQEQKLTLKKKGQGIIYASDIEDSSLCEVINKDLYLGELAKDGVLDVEIYVNKGFGYEPAEEKEDRGYGILALDSIFTPVLNVALTVEGARVGRKSNYDKLVMTIMTDGSLTGSEAIGKAAHLLVEYFSMLSTGGIELSSIQAGAAGSIQPIRDQEEQSGTMIDELDLPTRVINALIKHGVETVANLAKMTDEDFAQVRGLGKKSIEELKQKLQERKNA